MGEQLGCPFLFEKKLNLRKKMKNKKIFIILLLAVLAFANLTFFISFASAQVSTPEPVWKGIVPCGRNSGTAEEMAPCTLCHLVIGF